MIYSFRYKEVISTACTLMHVVATNMFLAKSTELHHTLSYYVIHVLRKFIITQEVPNRYHTNGMIHGNVVTYCHEVTIIIVR